MTAAEREEIDRWLGSMTAVGGPIHREFFKGKTDREFYQERNMLLQAIAHPADHLKQRYGLTAMSLAQYRKILLTVLDAIREHGRRAEIKRFSAYFLHAVQKHMAHHGEGYYYATKEVRGVGAIVPKTLRGIKVGEAPGDSVIDVLVQVKRTLRSKGGRKKRTDGDSSGALELFPCKPIRPAAGSSSAGS